MDKLTETNKDVLDTLRTFATRDDDAKKIYERSDDTKKKIVRSTKYCDEIEINSFAKMTGEDADYYTRSSAVDWQSIRLDGNYRLLKVNSSNTLERKVTIRNLESNREITASFEDKTLDQRHLEQLGIAEWGLHPATLKIRAKMKNDKIKDAVILSVENVDRDIVFDDSPPDEE